MKIIPLHEIKAPCPDEMYVILGIDANAHDQVIALTRSYQDAKKYCMQYLMETEFYDVWIEKFQVI